MALVDVDQFIVQSGTFMTLDTDTELEGTILADLAWSQDALIGFNHEEENNGLTTQVAS